jgi:polyisoprenoid-binding protein YceI
MSDPSSDPAATSTNGASALPDGEWTLDPSKSRAEFAVKNFWGLVTVRGHFNQIEGELSIDPAGAVAGELRIEAGSVDTGNKRRDVHLRSSDFFGADEHPRVVYRPTAVRSLDGSGIEMVGRLAIAGHEEPVTLGLEVSHSAGLLTLRTTTVVDRRVFGMNWRPLGIAHNDATLTVEAQLKTTGG